MHDTLTIHHATLTPAERGRLGELNERLGRYFRNLLTVSWVIGRASANLYAVTLQVHARSGYFHARAEADRVGHCIDIAFDTIVRQRRRDRMAALTARRRQGIDAKHEMTGMDRIGA